MTESQFEKELASLYRTPQDLGTADAFASQVEHRWSRRRTIRTVIIGISATVGGAATLAAARTLGIIDLVLSAIVDGLLALGTTGLAMTAILALLATCLIRNAVDDR